MLTLVDENAKVEEKKQWGRPNLGKRSILKTINVPYICYDEIFDEFSSKIKWASYRLLAVKKSTTRMQKKIVIPCTFRDDKRQINVINYVNTTYPYNKITQWSLTIGYIKKIQHIVPVVNSSWVLIIAGKQTSVSKFGLILDLYIHICIFISINSSVLYVIIRVGLNYN